MKNLKTICNQYNQKWYTGENLSLLREARIKKVQREAEQKAQKAAEIAAKAEFVWLKKAIQRAGLEDIPVLYTKVYALTKKAYCMDLDTHVLYNMWCSRRALLKGENPYVVVHNYAVDYLKKFKIFLRKYEEDFYETKWASIHYRYESLEDRRDSFLSGMAEHFNASHSFWTECEIKGLKLAIEAMLHKPLEEINPVAASKSHFEDVIRSIQKRRKSLWQVIISA